jgi:hypothetical protein
MHERALTFISLTRGKAEIQAQHHDDKQKNKKTGMKKNLLNHRAVV